MVVHLIVGEHQGCCGIFRNERMTESKTVKTCREKNDREQKRKNSAARESGQSERFVIVVSPECQFDRQNHAMRAQFKYTMNCSNYAQMCIFQRDIFVHNGIPLVMTC